MAVDGDVVGSRAPAPNADRAGRHGRLEDETRVGPPRDLLDVRPAAHAAHLFVAGEKDGDRRHLAPERVERLQRVEHRHGAALDVTHARAVGESVGDAERPLRDGALRTDGVEVTREKEPMPTAARSLGDDVVAALGLGDRLRRESELAQLARVELTAPIDAAFAVRAAVDVHEALEQCQQRPLVIAQPRADLVHRSSVRFFERRSAARGLPGAERSQESLGLFRRRGT